MRLIKLFAAGHLNKRIARPSPSPPSARTPRFLWTRAVCSPVCQCRPVRPCRGTMQSYIVRIHKRLVRFLLVFLFFFLPVLLWLFRGGSAAREYFSPHSTSVFICIVGLMSTWRCARHLSNLNAFFFSNCMFLHFFVFFFPYTLCLSSPHSGTRVLCRFWKNLSARVQIGIT